MDDTQRELVGKALYEACRMDDYPWDDILAKHVWIERAEKVVEAYLKCTKGKEGISQASDGFLPL